MKKRVTVLALLLAATGIQSAISATTAQLNISGTIEPAACGVVVSKHADFGTLKRADVTASNGLITLKPTTAAFTIDCDGNASTGITLKANSSGLSSAPVNGASAAQMGGLKAGSTAVGSYTLALNNVKADGKDNSVLARGSFATAFTQLQPTTPLTLDDSQTLSWGTSATTATAARTVEGTLQVNAVLDESTLQNKEKTTFTGTTVLTLVYN